LRERKKLKTEATIRYHALRLFRTQGYAETTVEQIADAAEVSPSTFFRYFPTKEDVVLRDEFDELFIDAFRAQPPELTPIRALRAAVSQAFVELSGEPSREDLAHEWELQWQLMRSVPELRAAALDQLAGTLDRFATVVAERVSPRADRFAVLAITGDVIGVMIASMV